MSKLIFIDTETTGLDKDPFARLCQVAYKIDDTMVNELFKPPVPIGLGAMGVHHITEAMVENKPAFQDTDHHKTLKELFSKKSNIFVAHNAKFDVEMINREGIDVKSQICTKILAQRLLPIGTKGLDNHRLQTLRHYFKLNINDARAHDAEGDVIVLEAVFNKLFEIAKEKAKEKALKKGLKPWTTKQLIDYMVEISMAPADSNTLMPFGKYAGKTLSELVTLDRRYCEWLIREKANDTDGIVTALRFLLNSK